ncbi:unnamed protein product [Diamesa serratosioi]
MSSLTDINATQFTTVISGGSGGGASGSEIATSSTCSQGAKELIIPYTILESLVAIVAVIGNALVIVVFCREKRLRRRTNFYIISLALADFLIGLLGIPFAVLSSVGLPKNLNACLFTLSILVVLCTISIFSLVAVSIDRYWAILHPLAYSRNVCTKTAIEIISLCWIFGIVIGFLPLFGWHKEVTEGCLFVEIMDYNYLVFLYFTTIITPALILAIFYGLIYKVILKQINKTSSSSIKVSTNASCRSSANNHASTATSGGSESQMLRLLNSQAQKREVKATQNLSIIVCFFVLCWIPLYTINCVNAFCKSCVIHANWTYFGIVLSHFNSAINPVLYAYHLKDFRGALLRLFKCSQQQDQMYRPSIMSQHQIRATSQVVQRRSFQPKIYIDSPIWKRQQQQQPPSIIEEQNIVVVSRPMTDADSGFVAHEEHDVTHDNNFKCDNCNFERTTPTSTAANTPEIISSHSNSIYFISSFKGEQPVEANDNRQQGGHSLYDIVSRNHQQIENET